MSFFGAVFASLTLYWQWHLTGVALALPFAGFLLIGLAATYVIRSPGAGIKPSPKEERAIMWSTIGEGVGLFLASNIVINLHRPDLLLPSMALVVGLHFLPIAFAAGFRPFYVLGAVLIIASIAGFVVGAPTGGDVAGFAPLVRSGLHQRSPFNVTTWRDERKPPSSRSRLSCAPLVKK